VKNNLTGVKFSARLRFTMNGSASSIITLDDNTQARLDLWERMAKAIIRAHVKLPMAKHNVKLNGELREIIDRVHELEPSLRNYYPVD
jgi:hypothetical protein